MDMSEQVKGSDWRERRSYDYLDGLTKRDWSWEIVRRNPQFASAWVSANSSSDCVGKSGSITIIRSQASETPLDRWGLVYSDSVDLNARDACVLWRPDCYSGVLSMSAVAATTNDDTPKISLRDLPCSSVLFLRPGDWQHIAFLGDGRGLQLAVRGASVLEPVRLLMDATPDPRAPRTQLDILKCFHDLGLTGRTSPRYHLKAMASRRLKTVLQALDGARAGARHREIAIAVYGPERVRADWDDPREHLKDHIRKTVRRGFAWMNGGYRSFLR